MNVPSPPIIVKSAAPIMRFSSERNTILPKPMHTAEELCGQHFYQMAEEYYLCEVELKHLKKHGLRPSLALFNAA